jgi:hypothetical protein
MNKKIDNFAIIFFSLLLSLVAISDYVILEGISLTLNNLESFYNKEFTLILCGILFLLGILLSSIPFIGVYKYKKEKLC